MFQCGSGSCIFGQFDPYPEILWPKSVEFTSWKNSYLSYHQKIQYVYPYASIKDVQATVPEFIEPVFTKTSPKRSFSLNRKRAFWLVFAKTGSIISGTGEASSPQKEHTPLQGEIFSTIFSFVGHFCPPGSGSESGRPKSIRIRSNNTALLSYTL